MRPTPGSRRPLGPDERLELARRGIAVQPGWCTDAAGFVWIRSMGRRRRWVAALPYLQQLVAATGLLRLWTGRT